MLTEGLKVDNEVLKLLRRCLCWTAEMIKLCLYPAVFYGQCVVRSGGVFRLHATEIF